MKKLFVAALLFFAICILLLHRLTLAQEINLQDIYDKKLQVPLFTGFLTLGSFLLTLKTFVIVKLKESLYSSEVYKETIRQSRHLDSNLKMFAPLNRLATFLIYAVICALGTSAAQMTIGFLPYRTASAICISAAITTLSLVIYAWWEIKANLSELFKVWEKENATHSTPTPSAS